MDLLFHPAFQSAVLPLLLAVAGVALLHRLARPWAAMGAVLALLGALAVLPGFVWPAPSAAQRLPWLVLGAAAIGALVCALQRLQAPDDGAGASHAAASAVACLGLTALAALGGSLLLAQMALMVAVTTAVPGVWAWLMPQSGVRVGLPVLLPMAVAAALIAWALPMPGLAGLARLGLLLLALTAPLWVARTGWADLGIDHLIGELLINHAMGHNVKVYIQSDVMARKRNPGPGDGWIG